mgnify:CR=1 FL=1
MPIRVICVTKKKVEHLPEFVTYYSERFLLLQ